MSGYRIEEAGEAEIAAMRAIEASPGYEGLVGRWPAERHRTERGHERPILLACPWAAGVPRHHGAGRYSDRRYLDLGFLVPKGTIRKAALRAIFS